MLLINALSELESLKAELQDIQSKYGCVLENGGCEVYFGSQMWLEEVIDCNWDAYKDTDVLPEGATKKSVMADFEAINKIVHEVVDVLFKQYNLSHFLNEQIPIFWSGLIPEPISSLY